MGKQRVCSAVKNIPPSGIRRFFDLIAESQEVISLGVGEPDFCTPLHIRQACQNRISDERNAYTSNRGLEELRSAVADDLWARHGLTYDYRKEVIITVGVSEALDLLFRSIISPGDEVIIPQPCYVSYVPCVAMAGGKPIIVNTLVENNFKLTAEQLEKAISKKTKAVLLSYPNNPTGAILTRQEQEKLAQIACQHDLIVISDDIYGHLTYGKKHSCIASLPEMQERTIVLDGFSKAYAMTGWRVGYAAGPPDIIGAMNKIHQYTMLCAPTLGQHGALEALRNGAVEREKMIAEYDKRRKMIVAGFNSLGLTCFEPEGAFYAFPSIEITGFSSEEFAEKLLQEEQVAVVPGNAFGETGEGHVRCSYCNSEENLLEALNRIEKFVARYR